MPVENKLQVGINRMSAQVRFATLTSDVPDPETTLGVVDEENRTVTFSFSSETPCERWFGREILSHSSGSADLNRINSAGPLLYNHDRNDLLGVVEKAWIGADRRGYCTVRFGKDERGDWAMKSVQDNVLKNVSFFYVIRRYEVDSSEEVYTALDWEVFEISLVTIPADITVGVGRSITNVETDVFVGRSVIQPSASADNQKGNKKMAGENKDDAVPAQVKPAEPVKENPEVVEAKRCAEIGAMCKKLNVDENTRNAMIQSGVTIEGARGLILNDMLARNRGMASLGHQTNPDMTEKEKGQYSLVRALAATVAEREGKSNAWEKAGFEREASREIARLSGRSSGGLFVPTNIGYFARSAENYATTTGGGSSLVATNLLAGSFIELLRNKSCVASLGAQVLSGLVGNVDIPRQSGAGSVYWVGEGGSLDKTGATFDKVSLTPKHIGAISTITRNMLQQTTPAIEMLVRADMIKTVALGVDAAALSGSGSSNQPKGIANQTGVNSVVGGTNGAQISIDYLIDMETKVAEANADVGGMAYLANARTVGALKKLKSTTGQYLWTNSPLGQRSGTPGEINGYPVARSNQARKNLTKGTGTGLSELFFGNWSDLLIGEWGVIEILPNPYASGAYEAGSVELRVMQTLDIACRHAESFSIMSDAITS